MINVNKIILVGNVGKDVEYKTLKTGTTAASFSMATNKSKKVGDQWEKTTTWHSVSCYGKLADRCADTFKKGDTVYVEGSINVRSYVDKSGANKKFTEVMARDAQNLTSESKQIQNKGHANTQPQTQAPKLNTEDDLGF